MGDTDKVTSLIFEAVSECLEQIDLNRQTSLTPETALFGENSVLDSLGLVGVLVAVEEKVLDEFDRDLCVSDDRALSQPESPFRTVDSLRRYVDLLLGEPEP